MEKAEKIRIAIHSVPRSGSTWLGNIFNSHPNVNFNYQPLFSYAFRNFLSETSSQKEIIEFFNKIATSNDDFIKQKVGIEKGIIPNFKKAEYYTHICYKEVRFHYLLENMLKEDKDLKVIGLVRNPFSTILSWLEAPKEFRNDLNWRIEDEWQYAPNKNLGKLEEFNGFEKWKEVTNLFLELKIKYTNNFLLVKYDKLILDTTKSIEKIFSFCNLEVDSQTENFINPKIKIEHNDAYSVFKRKKNDFGWKNKLPKIIEEKIKNDKEFMELNKIFNWEV